MAKILIFICCIVLCGCNLPEEQSLYPEEGRKNSEDEYFESVLEKNLNNDPWGRPVAGENQGPKNILIKVKRLELDSRDFERLEASVEWQTGSTAGRVGQVRGGGGLLASVVRGNVGYLLGAQRNRQRTQTSTSQFITVMDGTEGFISINNTSFTTVGGNLNIPVQQNLGESLLVAPTIVEGKLLEVRLQKVGAQRGARRGEIKSQHTGTVVRVYSGQSILIGGLSTGSVRSSSGLLNSRRTASYGRTAIILTPKILGH